MAVRPIKFFAIVKSWCVCDEVAKVLEQSSSCNLEIGLPTQYTFGLSCEVPLITAEPVCLVWAHKQSEDSLLRKEHCETLEKQYGEHFSTSVNDFTSIAYCTTFA